MPSDSKQTQWWKVFGFATAATAVTFGLVWALFPGQSYIYAVFFERSPLQVLTVLLFWTALGVLGFKHKDARRESAAYDAARVAIDGLQSAHGYATRVWADVPAVRTGIDESLNDEHKESRIVGRIYSGLERLEKSQSTSETREYFNNASEVDMSELEAGFSMVNYFIWLLPTLGFIGTVMGIGSGIAGFAGIIQSAANFTAVRDALPAVTALLGTAFDTTLLALLLSVIVVYYSSWLRNEEEDILNRTDRLCHNGILPLFREYSQATKELIEELRAGAQRQIDAANANRIVLEGQIRNMHAEVQQMSAALQDLKSDSETGIKQREEIRGGVPAVAQVAREGLAGVVGGLSRVEAALGSLGHKLSPPDNSSNAPVDARPASFEQPGPSADGRTPRD